MWNPIETAPNDWKFEVWPEPPKTGMRVGMSRGAKVTHIPTGMFETCDSEHSVHANRDKALRALALRLGDRNGAIAMSEWQSRFYIDHGMVHDRF